MTKDDWGCSSMAEGVWGQLPRPSRECYLLNSDRTIKGLLTPSSYHKRVKDAKSRAIEQITVCDATFSRQQVIFNRQKVKEKPTKMIFPLLEPCVCSNCFVRTYKLFDTPSMVGRKKPGPTRASHLSHPTPEEIQRKQLLWKRYLNRSKRKQTPKRSLVRRKRSPSLTDGGLEFVNEMRCSEVFWESPKKVDERVPIKNLTAENFWDFVYQNTWKGRIRVCEGELMYKITEILNTLVKEKVIGSFNARRLFSSEDIDNTARMDHIQGNKVN